MYKEWQFCRVIGTMLLLTGTADLAGQPFDEKGYRIDRFRAPVDRVPAPARRLALTAALVLKPGRDALFIDVLPVEAGVRDPMTGRWRLSMPHESLPGAVWHPETGRSPVDPVLWQALQTTVTSARRHHPGIRIVLFCRADCWMGWNAARRLARGGVREVYWFAEGIEGWHGAGRSLVRVEPVIVPTP